MDHHFASKAKLGVSACLLGQTVRYEGRIIIQRRIDRVANGNFGDHRFCRDGVWELRIDYGPGYRVYYARTGETVVLLLCGGSKRSQSADLKEAAHYWADYHRRRQ